MKKILSCLLICLAVFGLGCASAGSVAVNPVRDALSYVTERVDAYLVMYPDVAPQHDRDQYVAAKALMSALPKDQRVAAAQSWLAVSTICDIHDAFINGDPNLSAARKADYLRTTMLLRKTYAEAYKSAGAKPESRPVAESRAVSTEQPFCAVGV